MEADYRCLVSGQQATVSYQVGEQLAAAHYVDAPAADANEGHQRLGHHACTAPYGGGLFVARQVVHLQQHHAGISQALPLVVTVLQRLRKTDARKAVSLTVIAEEVALGFFRRHQRVDVAHHSRLFLILTLTYLLRQFLHTRQAQRLATLDALNDSNLFHYGCKDI